MCLKIGHVSKVDSLNVIALWYLEEDFGVWDHFCININLYLKSLLLFSESLMCYYH